MSPDEFNTWMMQQVGDPSQWDDHYLTRVNDSLPNLKLPESQMYSLLGGWLTSSRVSPFVAGEFVADHRYYTGVSVLRCTDDVSLLRKVGPEKLLFDETPSMELVCSLLHKTPNSFKFVANSPVFQDIVCSFPDIAQPLITSLNATANLRPEYSSVFVNAMMNCLDLGWVKQVLSCANTMPTELIKQLMSHDTFVSWALQHQEHLIPIYQNLTHTHANLVQPLITQDQDWQQTICHLAFASQKVIDDPAISDPAGWMGGVLDWIRSVSQSPSQTVEFLTGRWPTGNNTMGKVGECVLPLLTDEELSIFVHQLKHNTHLKEAAQTFNWCTHPRVVRCNIQQSLKNKSVTHTSAAHKKI